jgi:hypothetical protein
MLQEVNMESGEVETELAARDSGRLKRILEIECIRVNTENMEALLRERHKGDDGGTHEPVPASAETEDMHPEQVLHMLNYLVIGVYMQQPYLQSFAQMCVYQRICQPSISSSLSLSVFLSLFLSHLQLFRWHS